MKISELKLKDVRAFIMKPAPKNRVIQVSLLRDKSGFRNRFFPKFHVFFSENINYHIMSARKKPGNKSSNYILSLSKKNFKRNSEDCLGKLRSNFIGTEFHLFDTGENPKKKNIPDDYIRKEFCYIQYDKNILGMKGPRKLRIITPVHNEETKAYETFRPLTKE